MILLDTTDLGEAEEVLGENYTKQRYTVPAGARTHTRVLRTQVGPLIADEIAFSYDLDVEADPLENIALCRVRSGAILQQSPDGRIEASHPNEATAVGVFSGSPIRTRVLSAHCDVITIGRDLLAGLALPHPRVGEGDVIRLTSAVPISPAANQQLVRTLDYVRDTMIGDLPVGDYPLLMSAFERLLASTVLVTLPSTALFEPTIEDRHDSTSVLVRRAISFIDDNAHRDISLSDIAESIYVTPRALQYMFRKHRDCTPTEYLRRVRLHYAHLDLVAGDRMRTTVAQIAAKWGFGHLGRFALYYRQHHGQSPHVTLRH